MTTGCERVDWLVNCDRKIELDFSNKFKPVIVDFLNYKMSKKSVIAFSNGGLIEKRDLGSISIKSGTEDHIKDILALITVSSHSNVVPIPMWFPFQYGPHFNVVSSDVIHISIPFWSHSKFQCVPFCVVYYRS